MYLNLFILEVALVVAESSARLSWPLPKGRDVLSTELCAQFNRCTRQPSKRGYEIQKKIAGIACWSVQIHVNRTHRVFHMQLDAGASGAGYGNPILMDMTWPTWREAMQMKSFNMYHGWHGKFHSFTRSRKPVYLVKCASWSKGLEIQGVAPHDPCCKQLLTFAPPIQNRLCIICTEIMSGTDIF